jgi:hypothetical protein
MVDWLPSVAGNKIVHLSLDDDAPPVQPKPEVGPDGEERLKAECCCGGVKFTVPRPSRDVVSDDYMGGYVSPKDPRKWKAFLDLCRDCGRLSGASAVPWMLVPRIAVQPERPLGLSMGTIKTYKSSEANTRGFCGVCGATVFCLTTRRMPSERQAVVGIAMGILRAPEGIRAENWVTWRTRTVSWVEDARSYDADFANAISETLGQWGVEVFGEAMDFAVI